MATACGFDESNSVLNAPPGMEDVCDCLSVMTAVDGIGKPVIFSCWKMTADELLEVNRTARVWVMVCGVTMPPVCVCGIKPFSLGEGAQPL